MNLNISEEYFGELLPFIKDESITDITWNGRALWLDDLKKGRYKTDVKLSPQFVNTFSTRIANLANKNFNLSEPLLEAETDELRISIVDGTITNTDRSIAIRKTPAVRRLNEYNMLNDGYAEALVLKLLSCLVKGHSSIIVTGDVGSGKTELVKYLTKFIPIYERTISIEDNYELRLSSINPKLDCVEIKASQDGLFSYQMAIKAALRQLCKWLLMAEARSKEVVQLLEAASTGCCVMTTLHSDDVRKIPDRVVNMMGMEGEEKRNDVYNFFDVGVKVGIEKTPNGIFRSIDQICVLDRDNGENATYLIYDKGFTGQTLPKNLWQKVVQGAKEEANLFSFLDPDSGEFDENIDWKERLAELEEEVKQSLITEVNEEEMLDTYGETEADKADEVLDLFDKDVETEKDVLDSLDIFDTAYTETPLEDIVYEMEEEERIRKEEEERLRREEAEREAARILEEERIEEEKRREEEARAQFEYLEELRAKEEARLAEDSLTIDDLIDSEHLSIDSLDDILDADEPEFAIDDILDVADSTEKEEDIESLVDMFTQLGGSKSEFDFDNMTREELIYELKKLITQNWLNSLSRDELAEELLREVKILEECNEAGIPVPEDEMIKIQLNIAKS